MPPWVRSIAKLSIGQRSSRAVRQWTYTIPLPEPALHYDSNPMDLIYESPRSWNFVARRERCPPTSRVICAASLRTCRIAPASRCLSKDQRCFANTRDRARTDIAISIADPAMHGRAPGSPANNTDAQHPAQQAPRAHV